MTTARVVFRDFPTEGVPGEPWEPDKGEVRELLTGYEEKIATLETGQNSGTMVFTTRAALYAWTWPVDAVKVLPAKAEVWADTTAAYNGVYQNTTGGTGSGAWAKIAELPDQIIPAVDAGAGTANAIVVTSARMPGDGAIVSFAAFRATTSSTVVVNINDALVLDVVAAGGGDPPAGSITAGLPILGRVDTGEGVLRLATDLTSAGIQAAAEAAAALANDFANKAEDQFVADGLYSAKHWAMKAAEADAGSGAAAARDVAVAAAGVATDKATIATTASDTATIKAVAANDAATVAALARDGALAGGTIYPDIATGRAAVADNAYFKVIGSGDDSFVLYQRLTSTTHQLVLPQPSSAFVRSVGQQPALAIQQPNLFPNVFTDLNTLPFTTAITPAPVKTYLAGVPCLKRTGRDLNSMIRRVPVSNFPSGFISASVLIQAMDVAASDATEKYARFIIKQMNGTTEISGVRFEVALTTVVGAAITVPTTFKTPSPTAIDASCTHVEWWLQVANNGGSADRSVWFRDMLLCDGVSTLYRGATDLLAKATPAQVIAGTEDTLPITSLGAKSAAVERIKGEWSANDYPDPEFANAGATATDWSSSPSIVTVNGRKALVTPANSTPTQYAGPTIDVSAYASRRISASVVVEEKPVHTNGAYAAGALVLRLTAFDASSTLLTWPDTSGSASPGITTSYEAAIPVAAITGPTTIIIAENVQLPTTAVFVKMNIRVETTVQAKLNKFCIREGNLPTWKAPTASGEEVFLPMSGLKKAVGTDEARAAIGLTESVISLSGDNVNFVLNPQNFAPNLHIANPSAGQHTRLDVSAMHYYVPYKIVHDGSISSSGGTAGVLEIDCGADLFFGGDGIIPSNTSTRLQRLVPGEIVTLTRISSTKIHVSRPSMQGVWITQPTYRYRRCADNTIEAIYIRAAASLASGAEATVSFPSTFDLANALCLSASYGVLADGSAPPASPPQVTKQGTANGLSANQFAIKNPNASAILHPIYCRFVGITETP